MLKVSNLKLRPGEPESLLAKKAEAVLGAPVQDVVILKKSVDARKKGQLQLVYTVACRCDREAALLRRNKAEPYVRESYQFPASAWRGAQRPVIVGAGPAGLFCALMLARIGAKPIVLDRGAPVEQRAADVDDFWRTGRLNPRSNVQFGEGGAGTFSDGKLNTGVHDPRLQSILEEFVRFGAPPEIAWLAAPHIGTDYLRTVVRNLREELLRLGGSVRFFSLVTGLTQSDGRLTGLTVDGPEGPYRLDTGHVCFAVGHSARDTFSMLYEARVPMEQKPFAMGVRIEHLQAEITRAQYGTDVPGLPTPVYKLSCHMANGRSAFSFCVCPGGVVVAAASEEGGVVTNGMSLHARDGVNCNGALLVNVTPADFPDSHPLAGVALQRRLEQAAFRLGGGTYAAPAQTVADFLAGRPTAEWGRVTPSYLPGVRPSELHECLPLFLTEPMAEAISVFGRKLSGYDAPDAVLTAVESRSSSPVRILRGADYQSPLAGLYPCGEGAGYAGGIMSAAADGIRCAEKMADTL